MTAVHGLTGVEYADIIASTNPAYGQGKRGEEGHEYAAISSSHQPPPPATADIGNYEVPLPHPHQCHLPAVSLPTQLQGSDGGGVCEEAVYECIPGDQ